MDCLSDEIIQMFIDGELPGEERELLAFHVQGCEVCAKRISEQQELALGCRESINSLVGDPSEIPGFDHPNKMSVLSKRTRYRIIFPLAAASILVFFFLLPSDEPAEDLTEIIGLSRFSGEIDANLPVSDQELEISFYDEHGKMIE